MAISWISSDGSDSVDGMTTPGGYLGAHAKCGVLGNEINMNVIGKPQFGKPLKIRLGNICRAKETGDSMGEEITPLKISTRSGTDVDYVAEAAFMNNFSQYFETSLNIINPTSGTGGTLQDSVSAVTIYLPTDAAEGIYNNVYYTTDLRNIVNEVNIQRATAVNILNNREKYEAVVTECDNIYHTIEGMLTPQQQPAPAYKQEEFEAFKSEVAEKLSMQQDILMKIASELGLNKNKDGKQKG